jgi:hypothetical protein
MLSFFVDNGVRSMQITNKKEKGDEKKEDVILNLKVFIKEEKKNILSQVSYTSHLSPRSSYVEDTNLLFNF